MKVLGITGGVGSGKSTVLSYLEKAYHAAVISCDEVARQLQEPGGECYAPLVGLLDSYWPERSSFLLPDGHLDRKRIADRAFANARLLEQMNRIVHPAVKREVKRRIERADLAGASFAAVEAALLLEDGYDQICDEIWYIYADEQTRRRRLKASRGYSEEKIRRIIASQGDDGYFRRQSALTVDNSDDHVENTYDQIDEGLRTHGFMHDSQR